MDWRAVLAFVMGGGGKGRGVQKTMLDRAETIDFSLPKPGFTQNSNHCAAVKTKQDNGSNHRTQISHATHQPINFVPVHRDYYTSLLQGS
jgi:hypothetical protein